jgi:hypothetical protein
LLAATSVTNIDNRFIVKCAHRPTASGWPQRLVSRLDDEKIRTSWHNQ